MNALTKSAPIKINNILMENQNNQWIQRQALCKYPVGGGKKLHREAHKVYGKFGIAWREQKFK